MCQRASWQMLYIPSSTVLFTNILSSFHPAAEMKAHYCFGILKRATSRAGTWRRWLESPQMTFIFNAYTLQVHDDDK
jgi:hypothetical protein